MQLLRASSRDEETLQHAIPDGIFGFHAQQAVEKLYKTLLAHRNGTYPFSHDLLGLRKRVEATGYFLPVCAFQLEKLTEYAGDWRYDEEIPIEEEIRVILRGCIAALREFVIAETDGGN